MQGLFISGHHTNIGKTTIACCIANFLAKRYKVKVRKPVASGCEQKDGKLFSADAAALAAAVGNNEPLAQVCPYRFAQTVSPELAAAIAGQPLSQQQLLDACQNKIYNDDFVIIEGAGGLCSPISEDTLNIDLVKMLNLPIVIVVKDELGAVNQGLLSAYVAKQYRLDVVAIVLNRFVQSSRHLNNQYAIYKYSKIPAYVYQGDCQLFMNDLRKRLKL